MSNPGLAFSQLLCPCLLGCLPACLAALLACLRACLLASLPAWQMSNKRLQWPGFRHFYTPTFFPEGWGKQMSKPSPALLLLACLRPTVVYSQGEGLLISHTAHEKSLFYAVDKKGKF